MRFGAVAAVCVFLFTACGSSNSPATATSQQPPTASVKPPTSIGPGEGQLNLVLWDGYADKSWADPFTQQTGCKINLHPAGSSDEMVSLMKDGGGGQWDMVSASGDADLRLIYGGDVVPMNVNLIPDWQNFGSFFKSPPYNTISGVHYGVSLQWGPNTLLYSTKKFPNKPTSWSVIYDPANKGLVTVPDNPIQIADAALYLSKTKPSLGIKDPYEMTQTQFNAAVDLLKQQQPLIKHYWALATDEINLFQSGDVVVGAAWPYQTIQLKAAGVAVDETIPQEGATGWADTWMIAEGAAPQLRLPLGQVGEHAAGAGGASPVLRRDAREHQGVRRDGFAGWRRLVRAVPRRPDRRVLLRHDQVLEDAFGGLRQWPDQLRALRAVGLGVDDHQRLTPTWR
jgi:spermidine/putrescine-binding protein